jgi:hypothetical protein
MVSWLPNRKDWNCKMHCHYIKLNKKNYNFCESKEYREEKETKKIRGGCEGEHER